MRSFLKFIYSSFHVWYPQEMFNIIYKHYYNKKCKTLQYCYIVFLEWFLLIFSFSLYVYNLDYYEKKPIK